MLSKNEIEAFGFLPASISQLAETLHCSKKTASVISEQLVNNGLATKTRQGKQVMINKENTLHAQELSELLHTFPRLPLNTILPYASIPVLSLLDYPLHIGDISHLLSLTRQWTEKQVNNLTRYGILLKDNRGYSINPLHQQLHQFTNHYYQFVHYQTMKSISEDGRIIWHHGPECLFTTKKDLQQYQKTAVTTFAAYNLPLVSNTQYYYITKRQLDILDIIFHTILIQPQSKTYHAYASLLYDKTRPKHALKKAKLYNLTDHMQEIIAFIDHQQPSTYLPTWQEYETLAQQYGVR